jgi:hypothetical protein
MANVNVMGIVVAPIHVFSRGQNKTKQKLCVAKLRIIQ